MCLPRRRLRTTIRVRPARIVNIVSPARLCSSWQTRKTDQSRNQSNNKINSSYQFLTSAASAVTRTLTAIRGLSNTSQRPDFGQLMACPIVQYLRADDALRHAAGMPVANPRQLERLRRAGIPGKYALPPGSAPDSYDTRIA